ncbi:MAG: hypothetical protein QM667_09800 [Asticcacaulis sp.]
MKTLRIERKWLAAIAAAAAGLAALSLIPAASQARDEKPAADKRNESVRRCVYGPGIDTHVIDQETLLAQGSGREAVLIKVSGCRLTPHDILVFEYHAGQRICSPIDVQLSLRDSSSPIRVPCFAQSVTAISAEEAIALSKQPYKATDRPEKPKKKP